MNEELKQLCQNLLDAEGDADALQLARDAIDSKTEEMNTILEAESTTDEDRELVQKASDLLEKQKQADAKTDADTGDAGNGNGDEGKKPEVEEEKKEPETEIKKKAPKEVLDPLGLGGGGETATEPELEAAKGETATEPELEAAKQEGASGQGATGGGEETVTRTETENETQRQPNEGRRSTREELRQRIAQRERRTARRRVSVDEDQRASTSQRQPNEGRRSTREDQPQRAVQATDSAGLPNWLFVALALLAIGIIIASFLPLSGSQEGLTKKDVEAIVAPVSDKVTTNREDIDADREKRKEANDKALEKLKSVRVLPAFPDNFKFVDCWDKGNAKDPKCIIDPKVIDERLGIKRAESNTSS